MKAAKCSPMMEVRTTMTVDGISTQRIGFSPPSRINRLSPVIPSFDSCRICLTMKMPVQMSTPRDR